MRVRCALIALVAIVAACGRSAPPPSRGDPRPRLPTRGLLFETSPEQFDRLLRSESRLPTVVNVWASWCVPCRTEKPRLVEASKRYDGRVRFLGLDVQDVREDALGFIAELRIPYPSGFDGRGEVMRHLGVLGLPSTLFYRPAGELAFVHSGQIYSDQLERKLRDLVATSGRSRE